MLTSISASALEQEVADFHDADIAEDKTRENLASGTMALTLYKTELSQAREAQLGAIQKIFGDSEKMTLFTLPWRKTSKTKDDETTTGAEPDKPVTP